MQKSESVTTYVTLRPTRTVAFFCLLLAFVVGAQSVAIPHQVEHSDSYPMPLWWFAPFLSPSGFGSEALDFAVGLARLNRTILLRLSHHGDSIDPNYVQQILPPSLITLLSPLFLQRSPRFPYEAVCVCHSEPGAWNAPQPMWRTPPPLQCPLPNCRTKIGRMMYETDRIPDGWPSRLLHMDWLWVPSKFQQEVLKKIMPDGGPRVRVLHESVDGDRFSPHAAPVSEEKLASLTVFDSWGKNQKSERPKCRILSVGKFEERKAWDVLIAAFVDAFSTSSSQQQEGDVVELLGVTRAFHPEGGVADWQNVVSKMIPKSSSSSSSSSSSWRIRFIESVPLDDMPGVYTASDALILSSRGEGWGRPLAEAMASALPVAASNFSGPTEFVRDKENGLLVKVSLVDRGDGHMWAQPDALHLKQVLLDLCNVNKKDEMLKMGQQARRDMLQHYSQDALATQIEALVKETYNE